MEALESKSVDLVARASPPYPMIEMWDEPFGDLDPQIRSCFTEALL